MMQRDEIDETFHHPTWQDDPNMISYRGDRPFLYSTREQRHATSV